MAAPGPTSPSACAPQAGARTPSPGSVAEPGPEERLGRVSLWLASAVAGAAFCGALLLWWRHGATVFFDALSAGIGACM